MSVSKSMIRGNSQSILDQDSQYRAKRTNDSYNSNLKPSSKIQITGRDSTDHYIEEFNFSCEFCDMAFRSERGRTIHQSTQHKTEYKQKKKQLDNQKANSSKNRDNNLIENPNVAKNTKINQCNYSLNLIL